MRTSDAVGNVSSGGGTCWEGRAGTSSKKGANSSKKGGQLELLKSRSMATLNHRAAQQACIEVGLVQNNQHMSPGCLLYRSRSIIVH